MPSFVKVKLDDRDKVVDFLKSQLKGNSRIYENLFRFSNFLSKESIKTQPLGSCIKDAKGNIQGYLGCFAHKSPYHKNNWIFNMTEWVVSQSYRAYSLKLLKHFLKDNSKIFTNFSASSTVQEILPRFGFMKIDNGTNFYKILSNMNFNFFSRKLKIGTEALETFQGTEHESLIKDHIKIGGIFISSNSGRGYIFFKKRMRFFNNLTLIHTINFCNKSFSVDWGEICKFAFMQCLATYIKIDCRLAPKGIRPSKVSKRKMFVKGLKTDETIPSRAYSEPLQSIGNLKCF